MPAIVGPRREFVHHELAARRQEQLHGKQSDHVQFFRDALRERLRRRGDRRDHACRHNREIEDVVPVDVFRHRERPRLARRAPRDDDRQLAREFTPRLHHTPPASEDRDSLLQVRGRREFHLPFAVVSKISGLHHARQSHLRHSGRDLTVECFGVGHVGKAAGAQPRFLPLAVLRRVQHLGPRIQRHQRRNHRQRTGRNVLKLIRDDVDPPREFPQRLRIVVARIYLPVRHRARGALGLRFVNMHAIAQRLGGLGQHAPELAAAEDADGFARKDHGSLAFNTFAVWSARNVFHALATAALSSATIAAANSAALIAPALPMAKVATGTPPGICTMDSSESMPLSACDSTGTPSTGSDVSDAVIPGRCAAPPAPAMITFSPRCSARSA